MCEINPVFLRRSICQPCQLTCWAILLCPLLHTPRVSLWVCHSLNRTHVLFLMVELLYSFPSALPSSISLNPFIPPTSCLPSPSFIQLFYLTQFSPFHCCFMKCDCSNRNIEKRGCKGERERVCERKRQTEMKGAGRVNGEIIIWFICWSQKLFFFSLYFAKWTRESEVSPTHLLCTAWLFF